MKEERWKVPPHPLKLGSPHVHDRRYHIRGGGGDQMGPQLGEDHRHVWVDYVQRCLSWKHQENIENTAKYLSPAWLRYGSIPIVWIVGADVNFNLLSFCFFINFALCFYTLGKSWEIGGKVKFSPFSVALRISFVDFLWVDDSLQPFLAARSQCLECPRRCCKKT